MDIGWNLNTILSIAALIVAIIGSIWVIKINWKQYGSLFLLCGIIGTVLCYLFIYLGLYTFPFRLFSSISKIPFTLILTVFPLYVMLGVRYSPKQWRWKIPFYWVLVHTGVASEAWVEMSTNIIKYNTHWSLWDSYIWWWLFLLIFEWVGGLLVKPEYRKPLDPDSLKYCKIG
jgi:hypothetical protein